MSGKHGQPVRRIGPSGRRFLPLTRASGLSQAAFCRREGLVLSTFQHHRRRRAAAEPDDDNRSG
ncbi:IS66 family insertion sequence element accessory protein TnpA [Arhodomonas aquaeolei]|uniref:IS66 family insertion sequence element accessory protein TnpA n=1 Tax=Arhodomonas aquaeolei TaxID=2369 RepID=UPI004043065D